MIFLTGSRGRVSPQHFNSLLKQQQQQQTSDKMLTSQKYDYFLVLDFEATCDKGKRIKPQEIIEFPVLKVNAKTYQEESKFRQFVRPTHNPKLTDFCTELTKIQQVLLTSSFMCSIFLPISLDLEFCYSKGQTTARLESRWSSKIPHK